jgi:hypothetical protein
MRASASATPNYRCGTVLDFHQLRVHAALMAGLYQSCAKPANGVLRSARDTVAMALSQPAESRTAPLASRTWRTTCSQGYSSPLRLRSPRQPAPPFRRVPPCLPIAPHSISRASGSTPPHPIDSPLRLQRHCNDSASKCGGGAERRTRTPPKRCGAHRCSATRLGPSWRAWRR